MAKHKTRKTLDQHIHEQLKFHNTEEFIIFLVWGLFVVAFLVSLLKING